MKKQLSQQVNQVGSALLVTILVATILLTSLTVLWRAVSLSYESAMLHYRAKQNFYATESLILYGIGLIKHDLIILKQLKSDQKQLVYQGAWPKHGKTWGVLTVNYHPKLWQIDLQAKLFGNDHLTAIMFTNVLCQKKEDKLVIINWQNN